MSLSSLVFIAICWGCYRIGSFNAQHPGELRELIKLAWAKLYRWLITN